MDNSKIYHGGGMKDGGGFPYIPIPIIEKDTITISHLDFQGAFLTKTNTLFNLPAGDVILFIRLKPSVIFTGGAITNYYLSIGIAGFPQDLMTEYDAMNIVVGSQEYAESFSAQSFDFDNPTAITVTARSVGANLSDSASGTATVEIYHLNKG